jgi:hypothetical protein
MEVALRSSRTRTTVQARISRTIGSSASERAFQGVPVALPGHESGKRLLLSGRVVSNFIVQSLLGRDIIIYGDGSQTRSFCYVDDLVDGLVRLMGAPVKSSAGIRQNIAGWLDAFDPTNPASLPIRRRSSTATR